MLLVTAAGLFFNDRSIDCLVAGLTPKGSLQTVLEQKYVLPDASSDGSEGESLRVALQAVSSDLKRLPDLVTVILPPWETTHIRVVLPSAARKYVERAVGYEIERQIPWKKEDIFFCIDSLQNLPGEKLGVFCTVILKTRCLHYYEACVSAGLKPSSFVSTPYALAQGLNPPTPPQEPGPIVSIKLLGRGIEVVCIENGLPTHARYIAPGDGRHVESSALGVELSLFLDRLAYAKAPDILVPEELAGLAREIDLSDSGKVEVLPNRNIDPLAGGVKAILTLPSADIPNLLPIELRKSVSRKPVWIAAGLGAIAAMLLFAHLLGGLFVKSYQLTELEQTISKKKKETQEVFALKEQNDKLALQIRELASLAPGSSFPETLQALTEAIPKPNWVNEISWRNNEVTVTGYSPSTGELLVLLQKVPFLKEVRSVASTRRMGELEVFKISGKIVEDTPH